MIVGQSLKMMPFRFGLMFLGMMILSTGTCGPLVAYEDSELQHLKIQLEGEKDIRSQMVAKIADLKAHPPECSKSTGGVRIQGDPIGDADRRIADLEKKIASIENKSKKEKEEQAQKLQKTYQGKSFKIKKHWWDF